MIRLPWQHRPPEPTVRAAHIGHCGRVQVRMHYQPAVACPPTTSGRPWKPSDWSHRAIGHRSCRGTRQAGYGRSQPREWPITGSRSRAQARSSVAARR